MANWGGGLAFVLSWGGQTEAEAEAGAEAEGGKEENGDRGPATDPEVVGLEDPFQRSKPGMQGKSGIKKKKKEKPRAQVTHTHSFTQQQPKPRLRPKSCPRKNHSQSDF